MAEVLITYKAENESLQAVVKETVKGNIAIAESATKAGQVASKAYKDAANSAKAAFGSQEVKKSLDNQVASIDKLAKGSISLKTQLKNLKSEISALDAAGKGGTKQFNQLAISAAKLEDQISDTQQRVKVLASDTFKFDAAIGAVKGLAAGFAVAQGAVGLFAKDNEELQMAIAKTNSAIAILTGLQEIANIVTGQGAEKLGALALAQGAYNFVVGTSTGLTKAFRIALAATGIGLVIIALVALIENFDKVNDAINGTSATTRALASTLEETKTAMSGAIEETTKVGNAFELAKKGVISKEEALLTYNETLGATFGKTNDLNVAEQNYIKKKDAYIQATAARAQAQALLAKSASLAAEAATVTGEEATNFGEKIQTFVNSATIGFNKLLGGAGAAATANAVATTALIEDTAKERVKAEKIAQSEIVGNLAKSKLEEAEIIETGAGIISEAEQKLIDKKAELALKAAEAAKKAAEDVKNAREKLAQAELDILTRSLTDQEKVLNDSNNEIIALEKTFTEAKFKAGSAKEIEEQKKLQNSIEEIKKQATAKNIELEKQSQEKILAAKLEAAKAGDNATLQVILASLEVQQKLELESAETLNKNKLEITTRYGLLIANVNKQIAEANVNTQINNLKRLEIVEGTTLDRRVELIKIGGEKRKLEATNSIKDEKERSSAIDLINAETQQAITKENKTENQKRFDEVMKYAEAVGQTLTALNDLQKQLSENRIAEINTEKEAQLAAINESADTERSKIRQRAALELRTNRAIAEEKTKQAKADKALALFNVAINTAVAISKAAPNPFLIALAAGVGIAQAAIILAKPIPKFAQGGVVGGQLHSQGGTQIEAEKDEYIVKRSQSVKHRKELDAINTSTQAFRNMINERYVRPAIMNYVLNRKQEQGVTVNASLNSKGMESELRGLRKDIRNSRVRSINSQLDSRYSWQ
jgi:hypothetical protein